MADLIEDFGTVSYYPNVPNRPSLADLYETEVWPSNQAGTDPACIDELKNATTQYHVISCKITCALKQAQSPSGSFQVKQLVGCGDGSVYKRIYDDTDFETYGQQQEITYDWPKVPGEINFPLSASLTNGYLPIADTNITGVSSTSIYGGSEYSATVYNKSNVVIYSAYDPERDPRNEFFEEDWFGGSTIKGTDAVYFQILDPSGNVVISRLVSYNSAAYANRHSDTGGDVIIGFDEWGEPIYQGGPGSYTLKENIGNGTQFVHYLFLACTNTNYKARIHIEDPDYYEGYDDWQIHIPGAYAGYYVLCTGVEVYCGYYYRHGTYVCNQPTLYIGGTFANGPNEFTGLYSPDSNCQLQVVGGYQPHHPDSTELMMRGYEVQRRVYDYASGTWGEWTSAWTDANNTIETSTYNVNGRPISQQIIFGNIQMPEDDFNSVYQYRAKTLASATAPPSTWLAEKFISPGVAVRNAKVLYTKPTNLDSGWTDTVMIKRCSSMQITAQRAAAEYGISYLIKGCSSEVTSGVRNQHLCTLSAYLLLRPTTGDGYKIAKCDYAMDYRGKWDLYIPREVLDSMNLTVATKFTVSLCVRYGHTGSRLVNFDAFTYMPTTNTVSYYQGDGTWVKCGVFVYWNNSYGFIPCVPYYYGEDEQWHEINAGMS